MKMKWFKQKEKTIGDYFREVQAEGKLLVVETSAGRPGFLVQHPSRPNDVSIVYYNGVTAGTAGKDETFKLLKPVGELDLTPDLKF